MTKAEVRGIAVSSLEIRRGETCWDIGCGTGSVSVEMALRCPEGTVYALDHNAEAVRLTHENARRFACDNIRVLTGTAPEALDQLPPPDKVFLGGTGGRMDEIFQVADRVTVLRDGRNVDTVDVSGITQSELIQMMVGYNLDQYYAKSNCEIGNIVLETEGLTRSDGRARDISIKLRKGEIVGLAGLVGSGRTEFIQMLYGISPAKSGSIRINGKEVSIRNVQDALKNGICLVPEDRKLQGLVLINNVKFNLTISVLEKFFRFIGLSTRRENEIANSFVKKLAIKISSLSQQVMKLSGGNQQKIVIAKWLARESDILLLDEPTRGVDVGAKAEIYSLMDSIASQGKCIIMVSSELPEVINMSDHIYVLRDGNVVAEFRKNEIDQEKVLAYALGAGTNGQ